MQLHLDKTFEDLWRGADPFEGAEALRGEVLRAVKARTTLRVRLNGHVYFAKIHRGIGWGEILKDLAQFKRPILGAENEWEALNRLHNIGVETMTPVAFGFKGGNPARQKSFIITEELAGTKSLEEVCANWKSDPPAFRLKKALIERLAWMVGQMHRHGINHRDCYICHFHLDTAIDPGTFEPEDLHVYVIDLHRAQIRDRTPRRWAVKDVGGLYFSAMDIGLTRADHLRFMRAYERQESLRGMSPKRGRFWRDVERTAKALYKKHFDTPS